MILALVFVGLLTLIGRALLALSERAEPAVDAGLQRWGEAYLLGVLVAGGLLWLAGDVVLPTVAWPSLALLTVLAAGSAGLAWRGRAGAWVAALRARPWRQSSWGERALLAALLLAFGVILLQALSLPTLTWDAWNAWLAKSKAWLHAGQLLPVVDLDTWLAPGDAQVLFSVGAPYPEALPRLVAWLMAIQGDWNDAVAHLLWPLLWLALAALAVGALQRAGVSWRYALISALLLLTLPMVSAHASLPGYSDLWLAAAIFAAALRLQAWLERRRIVDAALALLLIALLPAIKLEGAIYAMVLLGAGVLWRLLPRWAAPLVVLAPLLLALAVWLHPIRLPLPGLGWLGLEWGAVEVPFFGRLALFWRPVAGTVLESMYLLPNWSLLWYLTPLVLAWRWRRLRSPGLGMAAGALWLGWLFHFLLFFFTDAAAWAENLTSLNRLLLHLAPLQVYLLTRLLNDPPRPYGRYSR